MNTIKQAQGFKYRIYQYKKRLSKIFVHIFAVHLDVILKKLAIILLGCVTKTYNSNFLFPKYETLQILKRWWKNQNIKNKEFLRRYAEKNEKKNIFRYA